MTITFPDISNYEAGISLTGVPAVLIKATEGTTYTSPDYARAAASARALGIPWAAYHFLHHNSDPAAQARHYRAVAGDAPCMLDVETAGDGTKATVADCLTFADALSALGGRVRLAYFPHWYWQELGSPSLVALAQAGMALVSSQYTTYSDTGPGWNPYGGVAPLIWQYTDAHSLNGYSVDYNAYRGTVEQLRTLLNGGSTVTMAWSDSLPTPPYWNGRGNSAGQILVDLGSLRDWLYDNEQAGGTNPPAPDSRLGRLQQAVDQIIDNVITSPAEQIQAMLDAQTQALTTAIAAMMDTQMRALVAVLPGTVDVNALGAAIASHIKIQ